MDNIEYRPKYGLFTAVAMIVGIVIGSGIFFKTDNILVATGGNVFLGIVIFCIAALAIIFGCLTISELASRTDRPGGVITYADEFVGHRFSCAIGWFQVFIYCPTLTVVVSWVVGIYTGILFGWDLSLEQQIGIGMIWYLTSFLFNTFSPSFGGFFQRFAMVIKLIPLFLIAIAGLLLGDPAAAITDPTPQAVEAVKTLGWITAIGPIAFAFDGWVLSTSISHEIRNSKRNLPKALIMTPIFILIAYLMYFIGISGFVGPQQVLELGDSSVNVAAEAFFGPWAAKALIAFVIISVMGTANGVILGSLRLPYSLSLRGMIPMSGTLSKFSERYQMPMNSSLFAFVIALVWWLLHYITMKFNILANSDISEISIVMSYVLYIALYYQVFRLWRKGEIKSMAKGVLFPALATLGSLFVLYGGLQNPLFFIFVVICLIVIFAGFFYRKKNGEGVQA